MVFQDVAYFLKLNVVFLTASFNWKILKIQYGVKRNLIYNLVV